MDIYDGRRACTQLLLATPRTRVSTSRTKTTGTIYLLRINGSVWTPVVLPGAGAAEAKDLGVRYANGISMTLVRKNPSVGQYTFCRGVYSFNPYDTDNKVIFFAQWQVC